MFNQNRILAIIPARGGSKGIPHKNIIDLCGKPLISYSVEAAKNSRYIDYILVSTDDDEIAKFAMEYGAKVPFFRPAELATDTSSTTEAIVHAIRGLESIGERFDDMILLQPTSPLRTTEDIDFAIEKYYQNGRSSLVSVSEVDDHPILVRSIENDILKPLLNVSSDCRRQDMPKYYRVNGCIYINKISDINEKSSFNDNSIPYIMEKSHSVDIDELSDLALAKYYYEKR